MDLERAYDKRIEILWIISWLEKVLTPSGDLACTNVYLQSTSLYHQIDLLKDSSRLLEGLSKGIPFHPSFLLSNEEFESDFKHC